MVWAEQLKRFTTKRKRFSFYSFVCLFIVYVLHWSIAISMEHKWMPGHIFTIRITSSMCVCVCAFPHNRNFTTLIDNFVCIESLSRETQSIIEIAENDHRAMNIDFTACAVALFYTSLPRRKKKTTNWIEKRKQKKRSANAHYKRPNVWCHCSVFPIGFECCVFWTVLISASSVLLLPLDLIFMVVKFQLLLN